MVSGFVDLSLNEFDFFLCFYQARRKGQCFIAFISWKFLWPSYFPSQKSAKVFVSLFYHMTTSPLPSSVWKLQWRVQLSPNVFYSVIKCYKLTFCLYFYVLFLKKELYMLNFLLRCGLKTKFPESRKKWNTKKLCLLSYIWRRVKKSVLS